MKQMEINGIISSFDQFKSHLDSLSSYGFLNCKKSANKKLSISKIFNHDDLLSFIENDVKNHDLDNDSNYCIEFDFCYRLYINSEENKNNLLKFIKNYF